MRIYVKHIFNIINIGIRGAFAEFNKAQTFPRSVLLVTFSNSSMEDNSDYASELVSRGAFALLGDTGHYNNVNNDSALYSSMNIPTIGMRLHNFLNLYLFTFYF